MTFPINPNLMKAVGIPKCF